MLQKDTKCFSGINCLVGVDAFEQYIDKLRPCDWQLCFNGWKVMYIGKKIIERTYNLAFVERILDLTGVDDECDLG